MSPETKTQDSDTVNSRRDGLRFRPRARLMTTLGLELISSDVVALTELVKNSFDADARYVLIQITGEVTDDGSIKDGTGAIHILDDGHGMNARRITDTWLEPATTFRHRSSKTPHGRRVLGEKGVGRFAAAKIGTKLELISKAEDADEVHLAVDWTAFEAEDKYLDEIEFTLNVPEQGAFEKNGLVEKLWKAQTETYTESNYTPAFDHGTLLRITGIRSTWTSKLVEEVHQSLTRLVSPYDDEREMINEFNIILETPTQFASVSEIVQRPSVLQYPHYKLSAEVDENGYAVALLEFLKTDEERVINESLTHNNKSPQCGPLEIFLNVWDRDTASLRGSNLGDTKMFKSILNSAAGVSVYRDGFRVLPFGEEGDDWLGLDLRRVQSPTFRLSNNQIVGYVLISSDRNPDLIDQTNREGLIEGPAFNSLRAVVLELLQVLESERYKTRPRRVRESRKSRGGLFDRIDLSELQDAIADSVPSGSQIPGMVVEIQKEIDDRFEDIGEVLSRYHRLATLGQLIDGVIHELTQPIVAIRQSAKLGVESLDRFSKYSQTSSSRLLSKLNDYLAVIINQSRSANDIVQRIARFGGRRRGRPEKFILEDIIKDVVALLRADLTSIGAEVCLPNTSHEVSLDKTEIQEVLLNLLTNSVHWLQQVRKEQRIIGIEVEKNSDGSLALIVEDSGPGVSENDREYIFDPYFTTKPNGVGLGLSIAGEIVKDYYDGDLDLLTPGKLGGARLRATLRRRV